MACAVAGYAVSTPQSKSGFSRVDIYVRSVYIHAYMHLLSVATPVVWVTNALK